MRISPRERRQFRALVKLTPAVAFTIEKLEPRRMLTASIKALIPTLYTGQATQTPLGDTITQFKFQPAPFTPSWSYYRFATDDAADPDRPAITTARSSFEIAAPRRTVRASCW